ncbi:hypothetical protein DRJ22_01360 [Candidatus Woesearchaeota archaeon]|nr:MAG: hypothetical protein B6U93_00710 [Candidatus Woesearchaeota archaeon ex4484_78]RLE46650.1 MAG: hypothetical protein DRJ22_01360 [Candidatus Woesearchaeota archaeon]
MIIRRLVKAGQASHTVSLPKDWIERNRLKKGDLVYLYEKGNSELVISPEKKSSEDLPAKEITINVDGKELSTVQREVTSAYINNFNTIILVGDSLTKRIKDFRSIIHDFVALEVADQTSRSLVAKDLLNLKEISIDKTVRRMDMLVRSMVQDCFASIDDPNLSQSVVVRDYEVNRAYFLLLRLLKSALNNKSIADFFSLNNDRILSYYYLVVNLENFGDAAIQLVELLVKEKKKDKLKNVFADVEKGYLDVMKAYFTKNKALADSVALQRKALIERISGLSPGTSEVLKTMVTLTNNIARIVIDESLEEKK